MPKLHFRVYLQEGQILIAEVLTMKLGCLGPTTIRRLSDEAGFRTVRLRGDTDRSEPAELPQASMLGDVNIAEPKALIGFAGPRVIEQTIRQKLPEGFQRSEFLLEHGMLDSVVHRRDLRDSIADWLIFMSPN